VSQGDKLAAKAGIAAAVNRETAANVGRIRMLRGNFMVPI
jgi:hypothetical protein